MATRFVGSRIPEELETAARDKVPALAEVNTSVLIRVALACLAGFAISDAIRMAGGKGHALPRDFVL
jgi:hypothetical protein